jgi:hypothetical protein
MFTIGICGPSCSGKGVVTEYIAARNHQVICVCQDSFFRCIRAGNPNNLEVPEALMMDRLIDCVARLKSGLATKVPYAGWTEQFTVAINDPDLKVRPILLIEGFLLFVDDRLAELFDLRVFVDVSPLNMLYRRLKREDGLHNIDKIYGSVIPRSLDYKGSQISHAQAVIDGNEPSEVVIRHVIYYLNSSMSDQGLSLQIDSVPWKVFFGDLICDHEWHPVDFENLKDWVKQPDNLQSLQNGAKISGNTFAVRKSLYISDEYEIRLNDGCNLFRYENTPTRELGKY